jgi:hypothetical protein
MTQKIICHFVLLLLCVFQLHKVRSLTFSGTKNVLIRLKKLDPSMSPFWHVYVFGPIYFVWPWESHRTRSDITPGSLSATNTCIVYHVTHFETSILHTRYVSTCVVAGCGRGVGKQRNKVNVYLPSLRIKVPDHVYVLGHSYTCHTLINYNRYA